MMPGMGQLYIHRIATAFYVLGVWILICYQSHVLEGVQFTLMGNFNEATNVMNIEWLLFIPSVYFFAVYDAYANTVENNKLFDKEQAQFLRNNYQEPQAKTMFKGMRR